MSARLNNRIVFVQIAKFVSLAGLFFAAAEVCRAEVLLESLELQGLTFRCSRCREYPGDRCELTLKGEPVLVNCAEALSTLLAQAADDPASESPTANQAKRYLLQLRRPAQDAKPALKILLRSPDGRRVFIADTARFLSFYSTELEELTAQSVLPAEFVEALWQQQSLQGLHFSPGLKAAAAFRKPSIAESEILSQLSGSDLKSDLQDLTALAAYGERSPIGRSLNMLKSIVERCNAGAESLEQHAECQATQNGSIELSAYARQARTAELIEALRRPGLSSEDAIKFVELAHDLHSKSSALHAALNKLLVRLLNSDHDGLKLKAADKRFLQHIEALVPSDTELALNTALLLSHASMAALNGQDMNRALQLINRSAAFFNGDIEYRSMVTDRLQRALKERSSSEMTPEMREFARLFPAKRRRISITLYCAAALGVVAGLLLLRRRRGAVGRPAAPAEHLSREERQELRQLLAFFDLPGFAVEPELTQVYRQRAKEVHPDTGHGPVEHFTVLNEKYQRAKDLLSKKSEKR